MLYAYEDLSDLQFEHLVILLCQELLGRSTQAFSRGPDGGRDAKFVGTAECHPSTAKPWEGITIIQAKHTNGYNRHFMESDFYSRNSASTVIGREIPRITNLRKAEQLDNYMLFANRRLSALAETEITAHISKKCSIPEPSVFLCGMEQLELYLRTFPHVPKRANLDPVDSPLVVSPQELADIVEALARHREVLTDIEDTPPKPRTPYERKNAINSMTDTYAKEQRKRYLKETENIRRFLAAPENLDLLQLYESVASEFQLRIISKRKDYQSFDEVLEYLTALLFNRDPILRRNKRLTRTTLFYMYWNCDIGQEDDATAD